MKKLFLAIFCSTLFAATAQDIIYYKGMGRSEIDNDLLNGDFIKDDTTSDKRDLNGRFIFDLGINIEPNKELRAMALLRFSNQFGGFYSEGSSLEFRQILLQGVLADKFNYQIGDMDLQMTPYTLFNNDEIYHEFESDVFGFRRDLVNYENFNNGNNWRLQGVQTNTTLKFDKAVDKVYLNVFGTRVRESNITDTPDRLFMGGNVDITQSKYLKVGFNTANLFDVIGTANDTSISYANNVFTGNFETKYGIDDFDFSLFGEFGASNLHLTQVSNSLDSTKNGGFFDLGISAKSKKYNTKVSLSYRAVNNDFNSPGAQSRRMLSGPQNSSYYTPSLFSTGLNGLALRNQTLFDRISDQSFYNQSLSPTLMNYNPAYNNVTPYGTATPNRQGITIDIESGHKDSLYFAHVSTDLLSEMVGEGMTEKRNFTSIKGGFVLNVNKLLGTEKLLALSTGIKTEKTTRDAGLTSVILSSTLLDVGIAVETFSKLDVLLGVKQFSAEGNEFYASRTANLNDINAFTPLEMNFSESTIGYGIRYRFSDHSFITINADIVSFNEKNENIYPNGDYKINQYYFNYTVRF